jgi:asparagine synthase (glutamine-hydrolysing)
MGFGIPLDSWLRKELKSLLLDYLNAERIKKEGLLNHKVIDQTVQEHLSGKVNHQYRLWALLMWEMWRERWMGN